MGLTLADYQALRGVVRHVLPRVRGSYDPGLQALRDLAERTSQANKLLYAAIQPDNLRADLTDRQLEAMGYDQDQVAELRRLRRKYKGQWIGIGMTVYYQRVREAERQTGAADLGRDLVGALYSRTKGTCLWCGRPARSRRNLPVNYHPTCARYYQLARGRTVDLYGHPLVKPAPCAVCQKPYGRDSELDHWLALGVARRIGPDLWARAHLPGNLRWLCHDCHVVKTGRDRRRMNLLDYRPKPKAPLPMFPDL